MKWVRRPEHDKRIAWDDDYAGDCWHHPETGLLRWVAVGVDLNEREPLTVRQGNEGDR